MKQFTPKPNLLWTSIALLCLHSSVIAQFNLSNPSGCNIHLPIFDNSCNVNHEFRIQVAAAPGDSLGVDVFLREVRFIIFHEWDADLDIFLRSPSGVTVELSTDNGGGNDHYGNPFNGLCNEYTALLSESIDEACTSDRITQGNAPFIGKWLPEGRLDDFNDGSNPVGQWVLTICDDGKEHYGFLEYVELVFEATSCITPSNVRLLAVDSTSIQLDWDAGFTCANSVVEFGPPGFIPGDDSEPGEGIVVQAACPPLTVTGLAPGSTFDVYVRNQCSGSFSGNSCPIRFSTPCSPPPATIVEDFNAFPDCDPICGAACPLGGVWHNATTDDIDWLVYHGSTPTSGTGPDDDVPGGGKYLYLETSGSLCNGGRQAVLYSNCIDVISRTDTCDLTFNYMLNGVHVNALYLEVTTDGGTTWQTIWQALGNKGPHWHKAHVGLAPFDGKTLQFRFRGLGGTGSRGDIAIDNIVFYGSIDAGTPPYTYYFDADADGYGRSDVFIQVCAPVQPAGFATQGGDCDDNAPWVNPGVPESPCDGFDLNCNGMDDEDDLPPPPAQGDTICSGEEALLVGWPVFGGQLSWFDDPTSDTPIHIGDTLRLDDLPPNQSPNPVTHLFYVEETTPSGCRSVQRSVAEVVVLPRPSIITNVSLEGCRGSQVDLLASDPVDLNSTQPTLAWYDDLSSGMPLLSTTVTIDTPRTYFLLATANGGCRDTAELIVGMRPTPQASIFGESLVCKEDSALLVASDIGSGIEPLYFEWNTGHVGDSLLITGFGQAGQQAIYAVTITGANGCTSVDTLETITITSVDSVQVDITPVSSCGSADGVIQITPLDGVAPYHYAWPGGQATAMGAYSIENLSQGSYDITVTDSSPAGCPFVLPFQVVNGPAAVINVQAVGPVSCFGGTDGCIEIEVLSTNNPTITWSNGVSGELNCGLSAGVYSVTVTEGTCQNVLHIEVPQPAPLTVKPAAFSTRCFGASDGKINLTVLGGVSPYQYHWSTGAFTPSINGLPAGTYGVTVTDARGCVQAIPNITVHQPQPLTLSIRDSIPPTCFGMNDGVLGVNAIGGNGFATFAWQSGQTGSVLSNLSAGTYAVTAVDQKGCTASGQFTLGQPDPLQVALIDKGDPVCLGQFNGFIDMQTSGGNGGYSYTWNTGSQVEDLNGIGEGQYVVTVTDAKGCTSISDTITILAPTLSSVEALVMPPLCEGVDSGYIEITGMVGGKAPFTYFWSTDESSPAIYGLGAGQYGLTVVDGNGCIMDTLFELPLNQPMSASWITSDPACANMKTGQICLMVSGGQQPLQIQWNIGQTGSCATNLAAGNYTATVTDARGCKLFLPLISLNQPPPIRIELLNVENVVCHGGTEGALDVQVSGGVPPYSFLWSNGASSEDIDALSAGSYQLSVTDANMCVKESPVYQVQSPEPLHLQVDLEVPPSCTSIQVDTLCLNVNGGRPGYQVRWNSGDASSCLLDPAPGDYSVTVTDAGGCTAELMSIKIPEQYQPLQIELVAGNTQLCHGSQDGSLTVHLSGGSKPYQFIWSNGVSGLSTADTLSIQQLPPGNYALTITDATGCVSILDGMQVKGYAPISAYIPANEVHHVSCKLGFNGSAKVAVEGGLPPYKYVWVNEAGDTVSFSQQLTGAFAGNYTVWVSDSIGCQRSANVEIREPDSLLTILAFPPQVKPISCFGSKDGSIQIHPTGGVPPYEFQWSNGSTTKDLYGLGPGTYAVTITDAHLCALQPQPFTLQEPDSLYIKNALAIDVSCYGEMDGSIDVDIAGGTPPYFYDWDLPSTQEDLFGLGAGVYGLMVFDANGCRVDTVLQVNQPDSIALLVGSMGTLETANTGKAWASASGGTPPFVFHWNNGMIGDTIFGLAAGWYEVVVTDAAFCTSSMWIEVPVIVATVSEQWHGQPDILVYPNPNTGNFFLRLGEGVEKDLLIDVFTAQGRPVLHKAIRAYGKDLIPLHLEDPAAGIYFLRIYGKSMGVATFKLLVLAN